MTGAGGLSRVVALQRATITKNAFNEDIETWNMIAEVFAETTDASAGESYRAQEVGAEITARFRLRHNSLVSDLSRVIG